MSNTSDDGYAREVIHVVHDLTKRLEEYTQAGDDSRQQLQRSVEATVAALRQDVHKAITSLQINQVDHKASHEADRIERTTRQILVDAQLGQIRNWLIGGLAGIVLIVGILVGWLVF